MIDILLALSIAVYVLSLLAVVCMIINDLKKGGNTYLEEIRPNKYSEFANYLPEQLYPDECLYNYTYEESESTDHKRRFYRNYITTKRGTGYGAKMKKVKGTYVIKEPRIKFKRKLKRK